VIIVLVINGETIYTTPEHPFYTDEGEWENAEDIYAGERIRSEDGGYGTVSSTRVIDDANQRMYNLTVDEAHTFFVGEGQWLVHNACYPIFQDDGGMSDAYSKGWHLNSNIGELSVRPEIQFSSRYGEDIIAISVKAAGDTNPKDITRAVVLEVEAYIEANLSDATKQIRGIITTYGEYPSPLDHHQDAVYQSYLLLQYFKGYTAGGFVIPK
jgi:hypothetical protein